MDALKSLFSAVVLLLSAMPALAIENVSVAGFFGSKAVLEIDGKRRVLKVGERSPEGVVLIAVDNQTATVEYDGRRQRITLESDIGSTYDAPATKEEHFWPDNQGVYRAIGSINGQPASFLIDTGAYKMAMNSGMARQLGIDYRSGQRSTARTASDVVVVYQVMLDSVQVGKITVRQVPAVVLEGTQPQEVLLGMSFLSRLDMSREGLMMKLKQKW